MFIHVLSSDAAVLIDDDELFEDPNFISKAGEFIGTNSSLITVKNNSDVTISGYGASFIMRKNDYTQPPYPKGEWRTGVKLLMGVYSCNLL